MTEKTRQIIELLKSKHSGSDWAYFVELRDGTGGGFNRTIDFFAFNLWPSKKYLRIAYEIKVSRGDFFRELDDPKKRERAEHLANECYFVVPKGLIKVDEVPYGWGLIEMVASGLRTCKRAQFKETDPLPIAFTASIARRSSDPPSSLPKAAWLHAGKEVDESALMDIAKAIWGESLDAKIRAAKREARKEEADRLSDVIRLGNVVYENFGWGIKAEELRPLLKNKNLPLPLDTVRAMKTLYRELGELIGND